MKIAYPWILSPTRKDWYHRFSTSIRSMENGVAFITLIHVDENQYESWEWATFLDCSDEEAPDNTRGITRSKEQAMVECDACLIKYGWRLVDDKYKIIL